MFDNDGRMRWVATSLLMMATLVIGGAAVGIWYESFGESDAAKKRLSDETLALAIVAFAGGMGGILYAMRNSVLHFPRVGQSDSIDLGWLADGAYGVAGAFVIFLVTPGMSESMLGGGSETWFSKLIGSTPNNIDWLEIIAVAIIGGYAGRSLMDKAADSIAQVERQVETTRTEMEDKTAEITKQIDELREKSEQRDAKAVAIAFRTLDLRLPLTSSEELETLVSTASYETKSRIFHEVQRLLLGKPVAYAERSIPILKSLAVADAEEKYHATRNLLARAYGAMKQWDDASLWIGRAIRIRDARYTVGFGEYDEFQAYCWIEQDPEFLASNRSSDDFREKVLGLLERAYPDGYELEQVSTESIFNWLKINVFNEDDPSEELNGEASLVGDGSASGL